MLCECEDERAMLRLKVFAEQDWRDRVGLRKLEEFILVMYSKLGFTPTDRGKLGVGEVRPASLLERVIDNLQLTRVQMRALASSNPELQNNAKNAEIVQGRLDFYQSELIEIRKSRETAQFEDLVGALGGAANQVFDEYKQHFAGHDRKSRELARLSKLCDQLYEVAHQMDDLDRVKENATNVANLNIVLDNLNMYENEFDEITKVQRSA
jgi:division protein CdvB (Snf7/Vps24/ESCRT-III family)